MVRLSDRTPQQRAAARAITAAFSELARTCPFVPRPPGLDRRAETSARSRIPQDKRVFPRHATTHPTSPFGGASRKEELVLE